MRRWLIREVAHGFVVCETPEGIDFENCRGNVYAFETLQSLVDGMSNIMKPKHAATGLPSDDRVLGFEVKG